MAVGAKHFKPTSKKHTSVNDSDISGGIWAKGFWADDVWEKGIWGEKLVISLEGDASKTFGCQINAIDLAKAVMAFWQQYDNKFA